MTRPFLWLVGWAGVFSAAMATIVVASTKALVVGKDLRPEVALPLLLIIGLIALVIGLGTLVAAFKLFDLTDRTKAFGVPEGTLQAVIALALILIFAITSLYLRGSLDAQQATLNGLTADQVTAIPLDQILSKTDAGGGKFNVIRLLPVDQGAKDFSNQLLTILGTLVGAVAGFYFGAKSVETGVTAGGSSVAPTNTAPPAIAGSPRVGETLRAEVGGWTGSPPPAYGHQWQRRPTAGDGWRDIAGANSTSYAPTPDDTGTRLRVAVTATNSAGASTAYSSETDDVTLAPALVEAPRIDGTPREGGTLSAQPGKWNASPAPSFAYAWQRGSPDQDDWSIIDAAQAAAYPLTREDVGRRLRVQVTASNAAGPSAPALSDPTDHPVEGDPINVAPPTISGATQLGATLTADKGQWSGWPLSYTYQWERADTADDTTWAPIDGSKDPTYVLTEPDIGKRLRVSVTVGAVTTPSSPTEVVKCGPTFMSSPVVEGTAKVGEQLTAILPAGAILAWPPPVLGYQWQRQSATGEWSDIPEGTAQTYKLQAADAGAALRVLVTASNELDRQQRESAPTDPVVAG